VEAFRDLFLVPEEVGEEVFPGEGREPGRGEPVEEAPYQRHEVLPAQGPSQEGGVEEAVGHGGPVGEGVAGPGLEGVPQGVAQVEEPPLSPL
jgi:hypothetical protein